MRAAETLVDRAGLEIAAVYEKYGEKRDVSERGRAEAAEWVASVNVVTTDTLVEGDSWFV